VLARARRDGPLPICISSVDHDPEFGPAAARNLVAQQDAGLAVANVNFQVAPLVVRDCGGKLLPVYLLQSALLASKEPVDLVVVDGPPAVLGGREGTLYQAMDFLRPGGLLVLDDAARLQEQIVLANWRDNLGDAIQVHLLPGFVKGLAVIVVNKPIPRSSLWEHRVHLTGRDIAEAVSPSGSYILVDEGWWGQAISPSRHAIPFLEYHGQYWGAPPDDDTAIRELERLRDAGAGAIAFVWSSFWWLDHFQEFRGYLETHFRRVTTNDRIVIFDLRGTATWSPHSKRQYRQIGCKQAK
jgi:hypothetical protein